MQIVYVDSLFLINLVINYIVLLVTAKICAAQAPRLRLLGAAALGAVYSVAVLLPLSMFVSGPVVKLAVGAVMVLTAFGGQPRLARLLLVFFAVSAAFGGAVFAAAFLGGAGLNGGLFTPISLKLLMLSFAVGFVVLTLVFKRSARNKGGDVVTLKLRLGDREVSMRALRDTGNALTDPMTGRAVIIAGVSDLRPLFSQHVRKTICELQMKDAVKVLEELASVDNSIRFQLVPYSAVGVAGGMLLAFKPDGIVVDGKTKTGMLLALSPNSVSDSGTYSALLGA